MTRAEEALARELAGESGWVREIVEREGMADGRLLPHVVLAEVASELAGLAEAGINDEVDAVLSRIGHAWTADPLPRGAIAVSFLESLSVAGPKLAPLIMRLPEPLRVEWARQVAESVGTYGWEIAWMRDWLGDALGTGEGPLATAAVRHRRHRRLVGLHALAADASLDVLHGIDTRADEAESMVHGLARQLGWLWDQARVDGLELVRTLLADLADPGGAHAWVVEALPARLRSELAALAADPRRGIDKPAPSGGPAAVRSKSADEMLESARVLADLARRDTTVSRVLRAHARRVREAVPELALPQLARKVWRLARQRRWRTVGSALAAVEAAWQEADDRGRSLIERGFLAILGEGGEGQWQVIASLPEGLRFGWARTLAEGPGDAQTISMTPALQAALLESDATGELVSRQRRYRHWVGVDAFAVDLGSTLLEVARERDTALLDEALAALAALDGVDDGPALLDRLVDHLVLVLRTDEINARLPDGVSERLRAAGW